MTKESSLEKYTQAIERRNAHIEANKNIFNAHEQIVMQVIEAENELRDAVAEANAGVSNGEYTVTIEPQARRQYNEEKMKQYLSGPQFAEVVNDIQRPPRISIRKNS